MGLGSECHAMVLFDRQLSNYNLFALSLFFTEARPTLAVLGWSKTKPELLVCVNFRRCSKVLTMTESTEEKQTNPLPLETKRAVLRYLRDCPSNSEITFDQYCNRKPSTFGNSPSSLRTQVQQYKYDIYRRYLDPKRKKKKKGLSFEEVLERHGLETTSGANEEFTVDYETDDDDFKEEPTKADDTPRKMPPPTNVPFEDFAFTSSSAERKTKDDCKCLVSSGAFCFPFPKSIFSLHKSFFSAFLNLAVEETYRFDLGRMENHGDTDIYLFESLVKGLHKHDGIRFDVYVHSKDQHVCKAYFRKGHANKHVILELPKMSFPRRTLKSEALGITDYNGVFAMARNEHILRISRNKASPMPTKRVLIIFDEPLSNAVFGLSHSVDIPKQFSYIDNEYKVLDQYGRSDCVVVSWTVAIASRMNRQIKEEQNVKTDDELLAEQMKKKCTVPDRASSQMEFQRQRELDLMKELEETRRREKHSRDELLRQAEMKMQHQHDEFMRLQERLAEAERRAQAAAQKASEETARVKQEQAKQQNGMRDELQTLSQQFASKEQALKQQTQHLEQMAQSLEQQKQALQQQQEAATRAFQQQQAEACHALQSESEKIRANAQQLVEEANRREQEAARVAAEATRREQEKLAAESDESMSVMSSNIVAHHPNTREPLTEEQVIDLVHEFADFKQQTYEEVMEWINSMGTQSEQDVIDLLFA